MKWLNARTYIAFGLSTLTVSVLLVASYIGLIPDRTGALRDGRTALTESLAASSTVLATRGDPQLMESTMQLVVQRNPDVLSIGLRRADGTLVVSAGKHGSRWVAAADQRSTDTQTQVQIMAGSTPWGTLEMHYKPLVGSGLAMIYKHSLFPLMVFVFGCCFVAFYFYLAKVLRQLDPSQAVPTRVRAALDTLAEGLLIVDRRQNMVLANQSFSSFLGKAPEELVGQSATSLNWLESNNQPVSKDQLPWLAVLRNGEPQNDSIVNLANSKGDIRYFVVNCSPVMGGGSRVNGVFITLNDVTQIEQGKVALKKAKEDADAANKAKSEFLANMSHEIRTPMNAILGFTELLLRGYGKSDVDSTKYLTTIQSSGKHLLELINDVLDISKIEAGQMQYESIPCAPHEIAREVVTVLSSVAQQKGITLDFEVASAIPESILTDPKRLRQIITNLAGNAIKFTERGSVRVVASLTDDRENKGQKLYNIDVIDSGIGIPADKVESVFEAFVQADTSITRKFGGTGLGLSISRRFAKALGGDIVARSTLGQGSTFAVTFACGPLTGVRLLQPADVLAVAREVKRAERKCWSFPGSRVLVVDDGPENRELASLVLEDCGIVVAQAENGQIGLQMATTNMFDAVLMDIQMPVMDGHTATRKMREAGLTLPIYALTADAMKGFEDQLSADGFTGYLTKPIDIDNLIGTLAKALGGKEIDPGTIKVAAPATEHAATLLATPTAKVDDTPLISRLASNPRLLPAVQKFTGRLNDQLNAMDKAFAAQDYKELAALAHWLKGAAGTVGYDAFTEPAVVFEQNVKSSDRGKIELSMALLRRLQGRIKLPAPVNK